ncbi:flagellar basal-body rod protein FlgG [Rhizobium sp. KVB221]|uniref:Flagellar basal-body rod protein FlgG n=1 Tax=Rhizobium setariae TaxID=2801340 RepID=A0A936YQF6_9HYPH|nr:flagellar basal-body rod protein FlgG [Rhizobium setariae]MBL0370677.1 flagellar basal-body rod protein FlgG [Rhizobium setariae]
MRALAIAATGMNAQQTNLEVIANNIANINTTGYKRAKAEFSDLIYQTDRAAGVPNRANQAVVPEGVNIGLGVKTAAVRNLHTQGDLVSTGNSFDMAIIGRGFFQIESTDGSTLYTRDGAFNKNADGELVTIDGYRVIPNITVPTDATEISINRSGQVFARIGKESELQELGQLQVANFVNEAGLKELGDNLFQQTPASGDPIVGAPDDPAFGYIQQGYLEGSNVDPVKEITELISAQRAYEMNSKVITTADEMAATVSKNMR